MILPKVRDKRFVTLRRGGTLTDNDHHLLALWAAECAEHVLHLFETVRPSDDRPRNAIEAARAWVNGKIKMMQARDFAGASQYAAREIKDISEAARMAALAAGQAAVVSHVAAHELGAAAYAIRAVMEAASKDKREEARYRECLWQRERLPESIRELVLDDQRLRNEICWYVFDTQKLECEDEKMPIDFKKDQKELYQPKTVPSIIDVPEMVFIAVDGKGDPNKDIEYAAAIEALYGLSYAIKMGNKAVLEYVIPPLEGFWNVDDDSFRGGGASITNKSKFLWTMLIRQPDFVSQEIFETAKNTLAMKKPGLDLSKARLITLTEGLCVQVMHIGSYDAEPVTIAAMDKYAVDSGYEIDINEVRRHHEIYLSDPRKVAPEKLKTIIRHPIKRCERP